MILKRSAQPEALLGWMDCLADPTRLRLMRLLERHELGVVELCEVLQMPQSTVSRHLKVLSDHRWTRSRREGATNLYRIILDELEAPARRLWLLAREQTESWATVKQDQLRLARHLRDRGNGSEAFFAGAAGQWDKLRHELYGRSFSTAAMLALLPKELVVADLGCGTGQTTAELAPHVKKVIAVDNSTAMLKAAKKRIAGLDNVDLRRGDLGALPLEDGSCDAALLVLALTYVIDPDLVLREMARILVAGGKAIIVDLLPHDRDDFRRQMGQRHAGFDAATLSAMLSSAQLSAASVRPLPPEPMAKGPALFLATATR